MITNGHNTCNLYFESLGTQETLGCESQLQAEHGVKGHLQTDAAAGGQGPNESLVLQMTRMSVRERKN